MQDYYYNPTAGKLYKYANGQVVTAGQSEIDQFNQLNVDQKKSITGGYTPENISAMYDTASTTPVAYTVQDGQTFFTAPKGIDFSNVKSGEQVNIGGKTYYYTGGALKITNPNPGAVNLTPSATAPSTTSAYYTDPNQNQAYANAQQNQANIAAVNAPAVSAIGDPAVVPSSTTVLPSLPPTTATNAQAAYFTSATQQVSNATAAYLAEAAKRSQDYQVQIDANKQKLDELNTLQSEGMIDFEDATKKSVADKQAALELEKQRFDENYNANQTLIGELDSLLTEGNELIKQMQDTTGLSSIRTPRINQTLSDIAARAGVIQAVISARSGQMAQAQNQLSSSLSAVTSILNDQADYYKTLLSYYDSLKGETQSNINRLTGEQKAYLDAKLIMLENDMNTAKQNAQRLMEAMTDPDTALTYAQAGVSLTDSPQTIATKLANVAYQREVANANNQMFLNGYSQTPTPGAAPVTITDSKGVQRTWYKIPDQKDSTQVPSILGSSTTGYFAYDPSTGESTAINNPSGPNPLLDNPDVKKLLSDPSIAQSGNYARTVGGKIVDLATGQVVNTQGTPASQAMQTTGKSYTSGSYAYSDTDVNQVTQFLQSKTITDAQGNPNRGSDNWTNPQVYLNALQAWKNAGGLQSDFLKTFPIKDFINPKNTWPEILSLGGGDQSVLKKTATKTTTTTSNNTALDALIGQSL